MQLRVVTSGHVTKMAATPLDPPYTENPRYTQTSWFSFLRTGVMGDRSLHCGNRDFRPFLVV